MIGLISFVAALSAAASMTTGSIDVRSFDVAIDACEKWLGDPNTWIDGVKSFPSKSGLNKAGLTISKKTPGFVKTSGSPDGPHYWTLKSQEKSIWITTFENAPLCNIHAGNSSSAAPAAEELLMRTRKNVSWKYLGKEQSPDGQLQSFSFERERTGKVPKSEMVITGPLYIDPTKDLQIMVTFAYRLGK